MRWLITGVDGFVARHLVVHLLDQPSTEMVWGLAFDGAPPPQFPGHDRLHILRGDVTRRGDVADIVERARPDAVLHLAAQTSVARSWTDPETTYVTNVVGQLNVLEAARAQDVPPTVVVASSSEVYGIGMDGDRPITEETPFAPRSPYAVSKATQDLQAAQYRLAFGLATVRLRLFSHTGPGRPPTFVASGFAAQVAAIEHGLREPVITVGNTSVQRDFTDVRDVVRAWRLAAEGGVPGGVYNVCSGRPVEIQWILGFLLDRTDRAIRVVRDPALTRAGEIPVVCGDPSAARRDFGWRAEIPLERTLEDLLAWWRERPEVLAERLQRR
jgi:GDP-4-dehydro-6-deoxy-D-mannose reductase